jgi:hypothetical protein
MNNDTSKEPNNQKHEPKRQSELLGDDVLEGDCDDDELGECGELPGNDPTQD